MISCLCILSRLSSVWLSLPVQSIALRPVFKMTCYVLNIILLHSARSLTQVLQVRRQNNVLNTLQKMTGRV